MAMGQSNIGKVYKINIEGNMTSCIAIGEWQEHVGMGIDDFYLGITTPYNVGLIHNFTFVQRLKTKNTIISNKSMKILTLFKCRQLLIGDKKVWLPKYQEIAWPI